MNVLIIGATSGIGYELWKHYASIGNTVAITGRDVLKSSPHVGDLSTLYSSILCEQRISQHKIKYLLFE